MSEDQDKDSKTEEPTEKKIRDAFDKGNVPFSKEAPIFASILAILLYFIFFMPSGTARLAESLRDLFGNSQEWRITNGEDVLFLFRHLFREISAVLLPAFALMMSFGLAASILQNMPTPVLERVRPQISRLSIIKGFGRIFGPKGLVEFFKSLIKIIVISAIVGIVMQNNYYESISAMFNDPIAIAGMIATNIRKILVIILISTATIAIADLLWTRYSWHNDLRMTHQEIKDERKQTDGDPIVKARQRSLARDRARQRMLTAVPRATLVIANPTHFAIALRYSRDEYPAPIVVAKGQDLIALKIRSIAEENGVPVFENPSLARSMYGQVSVDNIIPSIFYKAVAELIHTVYQKNVR